MPPFNQANWELLSHLPDWQDMMCIAHHGSYLDKWTAIISKSSFQTFDCPTQQFYFHFEVECHTQEHQVENHLMPEWHIWGVRKGLLLSLSHVCSLWYNSYNSCWEAQVRIPFSTLLWTLFRDLDPDASSQSKQPHRDFCEDKMGRKGGSELTPWGRTVEYKSINKMWLHRIHAVSSVLTYIYINTDIPFGIQSLQCSINKNACITLRKLIIFWKCCPHLPKRINSGNL